MSDYECPKCHTEHEATGSHEDDVGEQECNACGFRFIVSIEYDPTYETECATHEWVYESVGNGTFGNRCAVCGSVDWRSLVEAAE